MVRVSATAHRHIAEDHPSDYALCWQTMPAIIADPTYAGLHPHHPQNFILVKQVVLTNSHAVLVAVGLNLNAGAYPVRTAYRIAATKIRTWLRAGTLRRVSS